MIIARRQCVINIMHIPEDKGMHKTVLKLYIIIN